MFYPSYQLCVVRISGEPAGVVVEYEEIEKAAPSHEEVTLVERLLTLGRAPTPTVPDRTVVGNSVADDPAVDE